jgi:hypothetical protein
MPFGIRQITTMKVVFCNSGTFHLAFLPVHSPKSIAGGWVGHFSFFLASRILLAHFLKNILPHCHRIHLAVSKLFKGCQVSKLSKIPATAVSQCRGLCGMCFKRLCPGILELWFFLRIPATHTFFHSLKVPKLGCPILLANCFKENSVCCKLIGALPSAPPKSDESSLPASASNSS